MSHVVLHVWRVRRTGVIGALARMAIDRVHLRGTPGLRFHKLLGTGHGDTFAAGDADVRTWALLTVWDSREAAVAFEVHPTPRGWRRLAVQEYRADMVTLRSHGRWSGQSVFTVDQDVAGRWTGPVAAITRARIRPRQALRFWAAVPDVVSDLASSVGPTVRVGIGEAPIGVQGTFTVWPDTRALTDFAYRRGPHRQAIAETERRDWYAEELFARLAMVTERGTLFGVDRGSKHPPAFSGSDRQTGPPNA